MSDPLPTEQELRLVSLVPDASVHLECLHRRLDGAVYRLSAGRQSWILKRFSDPQARVESQAYRLLMSIGVPTLPVHGLLDHAVILEDLETSACWRMAQEQDLADVEAAGAVAGWYRQFHDAGRRFLEGSENVPGFLRRESDRLTPAGILAMGQALAVGGDVWRLAADRLELFRQAERRLPTSLNYNDFHWNNLALSRQRPRLAVIFDYHLLGIGPTYNDRRNVRLCLGQAARVAFDEAYGPTDPSDELAAIVDAPLGKLSSLAFGLTIPKRPKWMQTMIAEVSRGDLERALHRAVAVCAKL